MRMRLPYRNESIVIYVSNMRMRLLHRNEVDAIHVALEVKNTELECDYINIEMGPSLTGRPKQVFSKHQKPYH